MTSIEKNSETMSMNDSNPSTITVESAPHLAASTLMRKGRSSTIPFNSRSGECRAIFQILPGTAIHAVEKTGAFIANITEGALANPSEARRRVMINVCAVVIDADRNLTEEELSTKAILATINRQLKSVESHEDKVTNSSEDLHHVSQMTTRNLKTLAESLPTVINVPREHWSIKEDNPQETNRVGACISLELSGAEGLAEVVGLLDIGTEEWERRRLTPLVLPEVVAIFYPLLDIFDAVLITSVNTERSLKRPIVFRIRGTHLQITSPVVEMDASASTSDSENGGDESYRTGEGEEWSLSLPCQTGGRPSSLCKVVKVSPAPTPTNIVGGESGVSHFNQHPSIRRVEALRASIDPVGRHKGSGGLPIAIHLPNVTRNVISSRPSRLSCLDGLSSSNLDYYFTGSCRLVTAEKSTSTFSANNGQARQPREKHSSPLTSFGDAKTLEEVAEMAVKEYSKDERRKVSWSNNAAEETPPQGGRRGAKCPAAPVGGRLVFYYWNHNDICSLLLSSPSNLGVCLDTRFLLADNTNKSLGVTNDPMSTVICARVAHSSDEWNRAVAAAVIHDTGRFSATDLSFSPIIDGHTLRAMVAASSFDNNYNAGALSRFLVFNLIGGSSKNRSGCRNGARSIVVEATMEYGSSINDAEDYEVWATGFIQALATDVADRLDLDRRLGNGGEVRPPLVDHFLFPSEELMADRRNGPGIYSWDDPVRAVVELYRWVCETRIRRVSSAKVAHHRAGDWAAMHTAVLEHLLSPCFSAIVASGVWAMQSARDFMAWVVEDVILTSCSRTLAKRTALVLDRSTLDEMGRLALTWTVVLSASQNKGLCVAFSGGKAGPGSFYIEPGRDLTGATLSPIPSRLMKAPWRWLLRDRGNRQRRKRSVSSDSLPISDAGVAFSLPTSSLSPACYPKNLSIVIHGTPRQPCGRQRRRLLLSGGPTSNFIDYSPPPALTRGLSCYSDNLGVSRRSSLPAVPGFSDERASGSLVANLVSGATINNSVVGDNKPNSNPPMLSLNTSLYAKTEADILEHITLSLPCDGTFGSSEANIYSATAATGTENRYVSIVNGQNEVVFWDPLLSRQSLIQAANSKSNALPDLNDSDVAEIFLRERLGPILSGKMVFQPSIGAADAASEGFRWLRLQLLDGCSSDGLVIEGQSSNIPKHLFSQKEDSEADSDHDSNGSGYGDGDDDGDDDYDDDDDGDDKNIHFNLENVNDVKGNRSRRPDISSRWWRDRGKIASTESLIRTILKSLGPETKDDGTRATDATGSGSSLAFEKFLGGTRANSSSSRAPGNTRNPIMSYSSRTINVTDTELFLRQKFPYVLASIIQRLAIVVGRDEVGVIHDVCESISNILADSLLIAVDPDSTERMLKNIPGRFGVSISGRDGSLSLLNNNRDTGDVSLPSAPKSSNSNNTKESVAKHLESAMVPPPASRLLSAGELAQLASSGGMNNLKHTGHHRPKGHQSHGIIDRSALPLSSLPHLTSIYVPTNPRKILTDDQWFDVLVRVEAGTRQATLRAIEELEVARNRGEQIANLALGASEILKKNDTITDEQANWLRRQADSLIPVRNTALKNAAIITNTPKLVAIPSYNLSAVVRSLSDADYYSVIPNVWLGWNWIDIVTLAVRLALVPLAYSVSRGVVIGNKIAILFNTSSSLTRAENALND